MMAKEVGGRAVWVAVDDPNILGHIPDVVHAKSGDINKESGWKRIANIPKYDSFVRSSVDENVCFCLDCQQVIVFGGTVGNLNDHMGRGKHARKVQERDGLQAGDSLYDRVYRELSYCAFDGYAFDHVEKRQAQAAMRCPYVLTSETAARLIALAGLETQRAVAKEFRDAQLLYAGILSDGWSRKYGGTRFLGRVVRGYTADGRLLERTYGVRAVDQIVESKEFIADDFSRVVTEVGIEEAISQIGTDTPTTELAAVRIFNEKRVAAGKAEVDGTPCIAHRAVLTFAVFEQKLAQDIPQWAALPQVTQIFNRSAVAYFLSDNGCRKTVIEKGCVTRWLGKLKPPRDIKKMAPGLDAFIEENPKHAVSEAWRKMNFGSVQNYADVVGPYAYFAKDAWEVPMKLFQKRNAVGLAAIVYSFDVALRQKLHDPQWDGVPLPAARPAGRAALAKMDELEQEHERRAIDVAAAILHPATHKAMLKKIEPLDLSAGTHYLEVLTARTPVAVPATAATATGPQIDTSDPMAMMMTQKQTRHVGRPRATATPARLAVAQKSVADEVREKLEELKSVVVAQEELADFDLARFWAARYRAALASGETGRFERAAVVLAASAVGNPRIEAVFSECRYIVDDYRMRMSPATVNACLVLAENVDVGAPVLRQVVTDFLIAREMNFRGLIYRPSLIPTDDTLPARPADPQVAAALRFAIGRLAGDPPFPRPPYWMLPQPETEIEVDAVPPDA
jgi:hypothetical protein